MGLSVPVKKADNGWVFCRAASVFCFRPFVLCEDVAVIRCNYSVFLTHRGVAVPVDLSAAPTVAAQRLIPCGLSGNYGRDKTEKRVTAVFLYSVIFCTQSPLYGQGSNYES